MSPPLNLELRRRHVDAAQFLQNGAQGGVCARCAEATAGAHRGGELAFQGRFCAFVGATGPINGVLENACEKQ